MVYDLRALASGRGWSQSAFRYDFTYSEFYRLCVETYKSNSDFQEALEILSINCAELPLCLKKIKDDSLVEDMPEDLKKFLKVPLQNQKSWYQFLNMAIISYYVGGEIILFKNEDTKKLIFIQPNELTSVKNFNGRPYRFQVSPAFFQRVNLQAWQSQKTENSIFDNEIKVRGGMESEFNKIAMMVSENVTIDNRGLSIVAGFLHHIGVLKQGPKWNYNILLNEGRPSGYFYYPAPDKTAAFMNMASSDAAGQKIEEEIKENFAGAENAGKSLFLKNGLAFKEVTMKAKDLDFISGLRYSREMIANRLRIPVALFGSEARSTFNNLKEMKEYFFLNTCKPFLNQILIFITNQIVHDFWPELKDFYLCVDIDKTEYASTKKRELEKETENLTYLTENEKRKRVGLEELKLDNMDIPIKKGGIPVDQLGMTMPDDDDDDDPPENDNK